MKKNKLKNFMTLIVAGLLCVTLCACGKEKVEGTRWENEWGSVEFTKEGVLTIKTDDAEQTFYYTDEKGDKDNHYVMTYKTPEEKEKGEDGVFIPYYIRDGELYFKGECYSEAK